MASPDIAKDVKNGLVANWSPPAPIRATPTLHVDDNFVPTGHDVALLVADDGGPAILGGPWMLRHSPRRPVLRLTAFAKGRDDARMTAVDAADWICDHHAEVNIARIEDVSDPLITRDRVTGAYLASVTMPATVRQI